MSHSEASQVGDLEEPRVGGLHLLHDQLRPVHSEPSLQLRVQRRQQNPLVHDDPVLVVQFGPVDHVEVGVVQEELHLQVLSVGKMQETLVIWRRKYDEFTGDLNNLDQIYRHTGLKG